MSSMDIGLEVNVVNARVSNSFRLAFVHLNVSVLMKISGFQCIVVIVKHGLTINNKPLPVLVVETVTDMIHIVLDTSAFPTEESMLVPYSTENSIHISEEVVVFGIGIVKKIHFQSSWNVVCGIENLFQGVMEFEDIDIDCKNPGKVLSFNLTTRRIPCNIGFLTELHSFSPL